MVLVPASSWATPLRARASPPGGPPDGAGLPVEILAAQAEVAGDRACRCDRRPIVGIPTFGRLGRRLRWTWRRLASRRRRRLGPRALRGVGLPHHLAECLAALAVVFQDRASPIAARERNERTSQGTSARPRARQASRRCPETTSQPDFGRRATTSGTRIPCVADALEEVVDLGGRIAVKREAERVWLEIGRRRSAGRWRACSSGWRAWLGVLVRSGSRLWGQSDIAPSGLSSARKPRLSREDVFRPADELAETPSGLSRTVLGRRRQTLRCRQPVLADCFWRWAVWIGAAGDVWTMRRPRRGQGGSRSGANRRLGKEANHVVHAAGSIASAGAGRLVGSCDGRRGRGGLVAGPSVGRGAGEERGGEPAAAGRRDPAGSAPLCGCGAARLGFEIVIVDDGSTDGTPRSWRPLAADYPELRPITLASNVGQSAATAAGFREPGRLGRDARRRPAERPGRPGAPLGALPGHDAALGWRVKRQDVWSKRVISRWANRVRNAVLGQSIRDTGCSVRIFPREVALAAAGVPRRAPVLGPAAASRGMPDRPGAGQPPAEAARPLALQPLEPVDPGGRRPARRRLADAAGRSGTRWSAAARARRPSRRDPRSRPAAASAGGERCRVRCTDLDFGWRSASWARRSSQRGSWCSGSPRRSSAQLGGAGGVLVAQPAGGLTLLSYAASTARPGDHRRPGDGAVRLHAEPDAGRPVQAPDRQAAEQEPNSP